MLNKQILKAVEDVKAVLYVDGDDDYNRGVDDAIEAILRHLGIYKNYKKEK